jgi:hypothetical protein
MDQYEEFWEIKERIQSEISLTTHEHEDLAQRLALDALRVRRWMSNLPNDDVVTKGMVEAYIGLDDVEAATLSIASGNLGCINALDISFKEFEAAFMAILDTKNKEIKELKGRLATAPHACDNPSAPSIRAAVLEMTGGLCSYCGADCTGDFHVEHVVAKSNGGPNNLANYVPSCSTCNMEKGTNHVLSFIQSSLRTKHPVEKPKVIEPESCAEYIPLSGVA